MAKLGQAWFSKRRLFGNEHVQFSTRVALLDTLDRTMQKSPGTYPGPFSKNGELTTLMDACQAFV
jgi:hypothetical protein